MAGAWGSACADLFHIALGGVRPSRGVEVTQGYTARAREQQMSDANPDQSPPEIPDTRSGAALASGRWSVVALVVCFIITAVLVPHAAHLPRWVEVELVIGGWWLVWVFALAYLLYRTCGVSDDAPYVN